MRIYLLILILITISCNNSENDKKSKVQNSSTFLKSLPSDQTGITFMNKVDESFERNTLLFDYFYNGGGVSIGDINNDGLSDIFFTGNDTENKLYLNKGGLAFEDITDKALGVQMNKWSTGSNFVDINNDGWLDIYVCNAGPENDPVKLSNDVYINNGDLTFSNKASSLGLDDKSRTIQAGFFDYDNDGDLDVWLNTHTNFKGDMAGWMTALRQAPTSERRNSISKLYRNDDSIFIDVSRQSGVVHSGFNLGLSIFDINDDGWLDVYVANDYFVPDYCYLNNNGIFSDKAPSLFSHTSFYSMGSDAADINNDGILDLGVVDMTPSDHIRNKVLMESMDVERFRFLKYKMKFNDQYMFNTLHLGVGNGGYSEVGKFMGVSQTDWSWAALFLDLDNDGYKDYYISNGYFKDTKNNDFRLLSKKYSDSLGTYNEDIFNQLADKLEQNPVKNAIYQNNRYGKFDDVSSDWTDMSPSFSNGVAYGDLDNDGDLDMVVNNLGMEASILENRSQGNKYLRVKLTEGGKINSVLYSQIYVYSGDQIQRCDYSFTRGYQSSMEPIAHFGLGNTEVLDSVKIVWPDRTQTVLNKVEVNQLITIDKKASQKKEYIKEFNKVEFADITQRISNFNVLHLENIFDDFKDEILLPHKYSVLGPCLAVGDVNGDGFDDFYLGGSQRKPAQLFLQAGQKFAPFGNPYFEKDEMFEDLGALFVDVDNDSDLDLYVASGGGGDVKDNLGYCQDRLYINNGTGALKPAIGNLPDIKSSTKVIIPIDYDLDGDTDLFVGGRNNPGKYPLRAQSYLLENNNGFFDDKMTKEFQSQLPGMVTDAVAFDYDGDKDHDLIVVGEWSEPKIFINENGIFSLLETSSFENHSGWWQSVRVLDLDGDGDSDFVMGNLGENNKFQPSVKKPLGVLASDFDDSGSLDIVLTKHYKDKVVPVRGKECSSEQMPFISEKFPTYVGFASSSVDEILGKDKIEDAHKKQVQTFSSVTVINEGNGNFKISKLPMEAQLFPILDIIVEDYNNDGNPDLVLGGNIFDTEPETPSYDAGKGLYLKGNGDGSFTTSLDITKSGLYMNKNVKAIESITLGSKQKGILVANNNDIMDLYIKLGN